VAADPLGDERRLVGAFALDERAPRDLHPVALDGSNFCSVKRARTREPTGTGEVKRTRFRP